MCPKTTKQTTEGESPTTDDPLFERAEALALAATSDPNLIPEYEDATLRARQIERGGYKRRIAMGKARTQVEKLIHHMKNIGPISLREALLEYGVTSITRRVVDIQELGYKVTKEVKHNPVTGQQYTRYGLAQMLLTDQREAA